MVRFARQLVAGTLVCLLPILASANDAGIVIAKGPGTSVNGHSISGKQAVVAGDSVRTANETATLALPNAQLSMAEDSEIVYMGQRVEVESGTVRFSAENNLEAGYKSLTIRPVGKVRSSFVVGNVNGRPTVAALQGLLLLSNGTSSMVLAEGHAISMTAEAEPGEQQQPAPAMSGKSSERPPRRDGDEVRGGRKGGGFLTGLPGWGEAAILAGVAGGVLGGLALAGTFSQSKP